MPSKKKKYNARFPPARIKKIMQTDEDVGKVAAAVPVIISRALELFIESLILKSNDMTQSRNARTLSTGHIKHIIESEKKFDFLRDLVANMPDVQQTEEDGDSPSGLESVEPPPATRPDTSRRTNASSEKAEAATAEPDKPAKRPRGRPRKQRPQEEQQLPPKKRGRKKKPPKEETTDDSATEDATSNGGSESPDETPSPMARVVDAEQPGDTTKGGLRTEVPFAQYKDTPSDSQTSPLALTVSRPNSDASPVRGTSPYSLRVDHAEGDRSKAEPLGQDAAQDEPRDNLTSSGRPHGYGYGPDSPGTKHVPSAPVVTHPNLPPPYSLRADHVERDRSKAEPLGQDASQDEPRDNLTSSGRPHGYGYGPDSPGTKHVPSAPVVTHPNLPPQIPTAGLPYPIPAHMGLPSTMNNCSMPPMPSAYSNMMQCPPPPHQMGAPLPPYNLPMPFYGYPPPGALPPHHLPHHPPPHHSPHHLPNHPPHHPKPHPSTEKEDSDS